MGKRKGNGKRGGRGGGRGGGDGEGGRGNGRGRGRGRGSQYPYLPDDALDFNIQMYADATPDTTPYGNDRGHTRKASDSIPPSTPNRGRGRGFRGRGRGYPEMPSRSRHYDYGIGVSPNDRGRGQGPIKLGADAPLTKLLYQDRPLLRPIVFVPSVLNPILFDQDEALLRPGVEDVDDTEQSHVPTAARVSRVFSDGNIQAVESSSEADNDDTDDDDDDELKVVDFNDVGKLFEPTKKTKKTSPKKSSGTEVEEQFTGVFMNNDSVSPPASSLPQLTDIDALTKMMDENLSATERSLEDDLALKYTNKGLVSAEAVEPSPFYVDTQPTPIPTGAAPPSNTLPSDDFDDDIIVYVAPHPRKGTQSSPKKEPPTTRAVDTSQFTPYLRDAALSLAVASSSTTTTVQQHPTAPQPQTELPSIASLSFSFPTPELGDRLRVPAVTTPRLAKAWKRRRGVLTQKGGKRKSSFRIFGAMREEAELYDPKKKERRRGDSDLDWGSTDDDKDSGGKEDHAVEGVESPLGPVNGNGNGVVNGKDKGKGKAKDAGDEHGMEVDSDLDINAMQHFVGGLLGANAGQHVTMDDFMDEERVRSENEQDAGEDGTSVDESGSEESSEDGDAEIERVLADEEAMLISEALQFDDGYEDEEEEEEDESSDGDEDQTPRSRFQKRLERLRNQASSSKQDEYDLSDLDDYDEDDDSLKRDMILAGMDNSYGGYNKTMALFNLLGEGDEESEYNFNHTRSKKKNRGVDLLENLKAQWENDRLKKAAYKKDRAQARLEQAADPLSLKKGGKKGRKAMLAAARLDPTITVIPNRIIDMVTLVQQIKRFLDDTDGRPTMLLPPMNKATRKDVHELAAAFNLKSVSKGKGDARYTTLIKTSRTDKYYVDEAKVAKIVRRSGGVSSRGDSSVQDRDSRKGRAGRGAQTLVPRHREGDEVGKAAPKLSSSNLGFRMLSMMGWSEGERIGATGGLQDPLTAIIKHTKLGLGAAK